MRVHDLEAIDFRVKLGLLVVGLVTLGCLVAAALRENVFADWHRLRSRYAEILRQKATDARGKAAAERFEVRIVQNYLPELGTADRCITCHAGVEDPRMAGEPQPFTTHPGRHLEFHDPTKFGCTVCHEGQGAATEIDDAHGRTPYWDYPMLPPEHVRTTCTKCHERADLFGPEGLMAKADGDDPRAADRRALLERGRTLFRESGCLGCHVYQGKGGTLGPELTYLGEKTRHDFSFATFERHERRTVADWLRRHFLAPAAVSPGSRMPPVENPEDAEALTVYVRSFRRPLGEMFVRARAVQAVAREESGRDLYLMYCSACHGRDGRGGRVPDLRTPALNNPDTLAAAGDDYYRFIIASGRSGSLMPAWNESHGGLSREEIDKIVAYIRSWQPEGADPLDANAARGDARVGRSYFQGLCAGCHGLRGEGGIGNSLNSPTFLAVATDRFLAESIVRGRPGTAMPAWKHLSLQAVNDILAYIRSWQPKPPAYAEVARALREQPLRRLRRVGKFLYESRCSACHGERGEGLIGPSITAPGFLRAVDDAYLYHAITRGRPGTAMPAWTFLAAEDVAALIAYLRAFQTEPPLRLARGPMPKGDPDVGKVYYDLACKQCHGPEGRGAVGPQLANPVFLASASDSLLFHWIAYGRPGTAMKGFLPAQQGPVRLRPSDIRDVIAYLRDTAARKPPAVRRLGLGNPAVGREIYRGSCRSCHGPNGEGGSGPQLANPSFLEAASDGFLAATIVLGREGTPMRSMVRGHLQGVGQVPAQNVADLIAYMRDWQAQPTWRKRRPVPEMTLRAVESGRKSYASYCSPCHGPGGGGTKDGPKYFAPALNNPEFLEAASDGFLLATIARGRQGTPMRPFGLGAGGIVSLSDRQISEIVSFIRSWQRASGATVSAGGKGNEEI